MALSNVYSRRQVIDQLRSFLFLIPSLSLAKTARSNEHSYPKRFIAIFTPNGQHIKHWNIPSSIPFHIHDDNVRVARLSNIEGPLSAILENRFDSFKEKMTILRGLDLTAQNDNTHMATKMLSGFADAKDLRETIDQVIAECLDYSSYSVALKSLNLLTVAGDTSRITLPLSVRHTEYGFEPIVPIEQPRSVYELIFNSHSSGNSPLLETVYQLYKELTSSQKITQRDREKIEQHLDFLSETQRRLGLSSHCSFKKPDIFENSIENCEVLIATQTEILAQAIKCGATRVATLQLGHGQEERKYSFLPGMTVNHHYATHAQMIDHTLTIARWYSDRVKYLLELLDEVEDEETGETYLDNTLIFWGNELGCDDFAVLNSHKSLDMPAILFGGSSSLNHNLYIDYSQHLTLKPGLASGPYWGRPYNELLISIMTAMGLSKNQWENGSPGFGDYRLNAEQYSNGDRGSPLPYLLKK
ncbi:DUF1552 domain-containing protein [Pseudobacteriovorax antillogorgiicola]|uniref:DUF1552 domain-containing protein n=1 Tax=Pseudobacteriovorax antillogorgiicola TaxID=1513793 RepID=A0A1Y6CLJ5_9BACT|nr:DUF1552 domain-containing protein [Pseudobacteriovorax antillogorgiicola]TCS45190.1 uncharacterized protein DUF1552 [Pseudobacteriovorax antillogorgiicola]SMF75632.1 Protein of unknown function [Pseudobacteriovorax antillogorgiicola]